MKRREFWVSIKSNTGNPNPVWKPALWVMTLHFMLSGQKDLLGVCTELKSCEASLGHQWFAGKIQQLPDCWLKEFSAMAVWTDLELCLNWESKRTKEGCGKQLFPPRCFLFYTPNPMGHKVQGRCLMLWQWWATLITILRNKYYL